MVKLLRNVLCCLLVVAVVRGDDEHPEAKDELTNRLYQIDSLCSQEHNVPFNYLELYMRGEEEISKDGKCFVKCGLTGMGYLESDGSLNMEVVIAHMNLLFDTQEDMDFYINAVMDCDNKSHSEEYEDNSCERAFKLAECYNYVVYTEALKKTTQE